MYHGSLHSDQASDVHDTLLCFRLERQQVGEGCIGRREKKDQAAVADPTVCGGHKPFEIVFAEGQGRQEHHRRKKNVLWNYGLDSVLLHFFVHQRDIYIYACRRVEPNVVGASHTSAPPMKKRCARSARWMAAVARLRTAKGQVDRYIPDAGQQGQNRQKRIFLFASLKLSTNSWELIAGLLFLFGPAPLGRGCQNTLRPSRTLDRRCGPEPSNDRSETDKQPPQPFDAVAIRLGVCRLSNLESAVLYSGHTHHEVGARRSGYVDTDS